MKLLILEDSSADRDALVKTFEADGVEVMAVETAEALLGAVESDDVIGVVVDPDCLGDGVDRFVLELRQADYTNAIVVTRSTPEKTIELLDAGADDVLCTDIEPEEAVARLRAVLRRCAPDADDRHLTFEGLEADLSTWEVRRDGKSIRLTSKEMALLTFMMRNPRRVLTREEIGEEVWDRSYDPFSNVIEVFVSRLRRKIDDDFETPYIHTIVGRGYMFSVTKPGLGE